MSIDLPLMNNNITEEDLGEVISFLKTRPHLTQSENVVAFEQEWSKWLGVKYSVFVNSGASANLLTMTALRVLYGLGEIIVPTLTWVSDIATVLQNGFTPIFVDINPRHLGMDEEQVLSKITSNTKAVFLTHPLGFNSLSQHLLDELQHRNILLIEDVCESHGATFNGRKLGSLGFASNFSFYYGHHMTTIEGGMVCTNDYRFYDTVRMLRSHGMVRESHDEQRKESYKKNFPELNPDFIFAFPAYNVRSNEINAVIGRNQLKRLDLNNKKRIENFNLFLSGIDSGKYRTDFDTKGSVNYGFVLVIREPDRAFRNRLEETLRSEKVEFRRGASGGGNQLRQPYLKGLIPESDYNLFPQIEHVHAFGYYLGNFPTLERHKIIRLCELLNTIE